MCGISGIFSQRALPAESLISSLAAIKHRGPDDTYLAALNGDAPAFFSCHLSSPYMKQLLAGPGDCRASGWAGYNRLSIIDTSAAAAKPLYDEAQDCLFFMNGEVYNYRSLAQSFFPGEKWLTATDTEVAFRLYLKLGDAFVQQLRGMFAIVVIHPKAHTVKVWRDRFGIKPFYYTITDDLFAFSSEIGGIFSFGQTAPCFDRQQLAHQLYLTGSLSPATIYKNIHSLEPGCYLQVDTKYFQHRTVPYWQLSYEPTPDTISSDELLHDVQMLCALSLEGVANTPKALMLSGGLDSGLLAAMMKGTEAMEACTLYADAGSHANELAYTRMNAQHAAMPLLEISMPADMPADMLEAFCRAEEQPNIAPEPAWFLAAAMKDRVRILYNALGPDELFYGYGHYVKAKKISPAMGLLQWIPQKWLPAVKNGKLADLKRFGWFAFPFISRSVAGWEEIKVLFADEDTRSWTHPLETVRQQALRCFPDFEKCNALKQMSYLDIYFYIASYHSFRSDRPAMLHHIEMRFPYLDHVFVQKYFNLTGLDKGLANGNEKPFFRRHTRSALHPAVFDMKKTGFAMNDSWLASLRPGVIREGLSDVLATEAADNFCTTPEKSWLLYSLSRLAAVYKIR